MVTMSHVRIAQVSCTALAMLHPATRAAVPITFGSSLESNGGQQGRNKGIELGELLESLLGACGAWDPLHPGKDGREVRVACRQLSDSVLCVQACNAASPGPGFTHPWGVTRKGVLSEQCLSERLMLFVQDIFEQAVHDLLAALVKNQKSNTRCSCDDCVTESDAVAAFDALAIEAINHGPYEGFDLILQMEQLRTGECTRVPAPCTHLQRDVQRSGMLQDRLQEFVEEHDVGPVYSKAASTLVCHSVLLCSVHLYIIRIRLVMHASMCLHMG